MSFLPISKEDMEEMGLERLDFVYVIGDAYVDHPSFGPAIISRVLESRGYSVGIISQPDWKDKESVTVLGEPRLGFLVSSGNMDSMVNHYTVAKKRRAVDAYTPGGVMGKRPDYAVSVYGNLIRQTYKHTPVILGGIEASLRRLSHYDYWSDKVKRSVLLDSAADLISYGMGERSIVEIADALAAGIPVEQITFIAGTVYKSKTLEHLEDPVILPDYEQVVLSREAYGRSFYIQYRNTDSISGKTLAESYGNRGYVIQNPPAAPLSTMEMDDVYELPYERRPHPCYGGEDVGRGFLTGGNTSEDVGKRSLTGGNACEDVGRGSLAGGNASQNEGKGHIKAIDEIKFSITSCRGCYGGCSFCALTFHQGRVIQSRSHESILKEAKNMARDPEFKGYIHDVGGPTADFRRPACDKQLKYGVCTHRQCLTPAPCPNLVADHSDYISLLRKLRKLPGVKKVFIRSGIRYDYVLADKKTDFLRELCKYHVSGQLKVAPEHVCDRVLYYMGKPESSVYKKFIREYQEMNRKLGTDQYVVPYLMSSHPGSDLRAAVELAEYLRDIGHNPEQVQDFYPTPSTLSTCMYYTGVDPRDGKKVYVPRNPHEKALQRALLQYRNPENYDMIIEALTLADRRDLIGFGPKALVPPRKLRGDSHEKAKDTASRGKRKSPGAYEKAKDTASCGKNSAGNVAGRRTTGRESSGNDGFQGRRAERNSFQKRKSYRRGNRNL